MANVDLEQGEDYEEEVLEDDEEVEEDGDVDTVYDTFYGIKKTYVYIGIAVVIVLVIALAVFSTRKKKEKPVEDDIIYDQTYDMTSEVTIGGDDTSTMPEPDYSQDMPPVDEPIADDYVVNFEELSTEDEILLRSYGYTGDEIEFSISNDFSVEEMVARAQKRLDDANRESWIRTSDVASPEYKYLMSMSYLGQADTDTIVDQSELEFLDQHIRRSSQVINCDYEKCPLKGMQLYLKCQIADDTFYWYPVTPERWVTLPDKGNIVLNIQFMEYGEGHYIIGAAETDSTLNTIDSSHNIDDVTAGTADTSTEIEETGEESPNPGFITE